MDQGWHNLFLLKVYLARTSFRLDQLQLDTWLSHGTERCCLPVGLGILFPHDSVKLVVVLMIQSMTIKLIKTNPVLTWYEKMKPT